MITDAVEMEGVSEKRCDVCVIGAGAAGITLGLEFANTSMETCILESGGLQLEADTQALYQGDVVGVSSPPLAASRLRCFGGSTNHWGGWLMPLDEMDFERRDWVPGSGWPFGRKELLPYYRKAQAMCESGPFDYDAGAWEDDAHTRFSFPAQRVQTVIWQHSKPVRFGAKYAQQLREARNVEVVLHANVIDLETTDDGRHIQSVNVSTLGGRRLRVTAAHFILASGGIENARLLLASRSRSAHGVANDNDMVGRYYAGHPRIDGIAEAVFLDEQSAATLYDTFESPRSPYPVTGFLRLADATQQREGLLNSAYRIQRAPSQFTDDEAADLGPALTSVARDLLGQHGEDESYMVLRARTEVIPNPQSRVLLGDDVDALGMPKVKLDWRLTPQDYESLERSTRLLAEAFGEAGLGRMRLPDWSDLGPDGWIKGFFGSWHHMGTTRMGDDRSKSVVDHNGRSHQVDNLYVAGSSVFCTYSWGTPTLTILALTLRLAEHIRNLQAS